jgi:DNA mismatch endonuclease (patch repair protein)
MASVRNKGTEPEIHLRKALFGMGYRYKINDKTLPGSPDIVLPKYKSVVFIHGCFWHGHSNCSKVIKPNSNIEFWKSKIRKNKLRDQKAYSELQNMKWNILTIWSCELRNIKSFTSKIEQIDKDLQTHCQAHTLPRL